MALRPANQTDFNKRLAATHHHLWENDFALTWAEGQAITLEQAIEYALTEVGV